MAKEWINHKGQKVPSKYVPTMDKKKDKLSNSIFKTANSLHAKLADFKHGLLNKCDEIYEEMLEDAEIAKTARKGNYTITSFDKKIKIEVNVNEKIEFDDQINFAQEKLNEFIESKTKDSDTDLAELVNHAFTTTKGRLDSSRILGLFSLKIKDPLWKQAMNLIKKSIQRNVTKRYVRIWEKNDEGKYESIDLNFSSI